MSESTSAGGGWDATQSRLVVKGETLWKIAERYYGDGKLCPKISEANRDVLKDPNAVGILKA